MERHARAVKAYKFASLSPEKDKEIEKDQEQGFIKKSAEVTEKKDIGYRKAAKFLLLLGKKEAAEVLKHFSDEEIKAITREIATIKRIPKDESVKILEEFGYLKPKKPQITNGGVEAARELICYALGEEKGLEVFNKVLPFGGEKPFAFLEDLENEQLIMVLRKESAAVLAIIFSYLDPLKASVILEALHPDVQKQIVLRMSGMKRVAPEAVRAIETTLIERVRTQGKVVTEEIDGSSVLAAILKNMNLSDEGRILSELADVNEDISKEVKEKLFTVDSVLDLRDKDLQKVLRDYSDKEIAVLLKGQNEGFRKKIFGNLSSRRVEFITMEEDALGPMLRSEVDKSMKDFLDYLRELELRGSILFTGRKDEYI
ncbi:MAG: flagellar motor switch protein FliG [Spirochaetes bacterium]|nr:MAG: flagellar motor switch protein FliG [Spirochaetota bacterium]